MMNNEAATVIEYKAVISVIESINAKLSGLFTAIFNKNPNKMPQNVLNSALSFSIVSLVLNELIAM
jgi:hypothetical protein